MLKPRQHERCFECGKHFTVPGDTPSVLVRNPAVALAKCASCSGTSPDVVRESTVMLRNLRQKRIASLERCGMRACQRCGSSIVRGPTALDQERFDRYDCGGCQ